MRSQTPPPITGFELTAGRRNLVLDELVRRAQAGQAIEALHLSDVALAADAIALRHRLGGLEHGHVDRLVHRHQQLLARRLRVRVVVARGDARIQRRVAVDHRAFARRVVGVDGAGVDETLDARVERALAHQPFAQLDGSAARLAELAPVFGRRLAQGLAWACKAISIPIITAVTVLAIDQLTKRVFAS